MKNLARTLQTIPRRRFSAKGGILAEQDGLKTHVFTSSQIFDVTYGENQVEYLVVGGGGGGGAGTHNAGGGGGAGGFLHGVATVSTGEYPVVVGAGAPGEISGEYATGVTGGASSFNGDTANGGGQGSTGGSVLEYTATSVTNASGGGGSDPSGPPGTGTSATGTVYGNDGGTGGTNSGGGGGGAGGKGSNGSVDTPGAGGVGRASPLSGASIVYAAGGDGGSGVLNVNGANAQANTGNGGEGSSNNGPPGKNGGNGGSGIVLVRYVAKPNYAPFSYVSAQNAAALGWVQNSGDGTAAMTISGECSERLTFEEALAYCHSRGGRLPTLDEVLENRVSGTGCLYDYELVWTSTSADKYGMSHYVVLGINGAGSEVLCNNQDRAYVRPLADEDVSRTDPVVLENAFLRNWLQHN